MASISSWDKYKEGMIIEWSFSFTLDQMKKFAELSGDYNPLHRDAEFARSKGYSSPVIYGILLATQVSRLIGQEMPDNNAILTSINFEYYLPSYPNDDLLFNASLINKSESTHSLEFKCYIAKSGKKLSGGTVTAIWKN